MKKPWRIGMLLVFCVSSLLAEGAMAGERAFSWTQAPAQGDYIGVDLSTYSLGKYLTECQVNRPEILNDVHQQLKDGKYYRKSTKDQKGRGMTLTVSIDPNYTLRIVTWRNETCPECEGSGKRKKEFGKISNHLNVNFKCLKCDGDGVLENHTTEKYYILSPEDFANPEMGRRIMQNRAFANAPRGADQWVERLVSKNPRERLDACIWLDQNYVRVGTDFQAIMPMLKKARFYDADAKRKTMVWRFWAGKDVQSEGNRNYYYIYANSKNGKITKKGFAVQ